MTLPHKSLDAQHNPIPFCNCPHTCLHGVAGYLVTGGAEWPARPTSHQSHTAPLGTFQVHVVLHPPDPTCLIENLLNPSPPEASVYDQQNTLTHGTYFDRSACTDTWVSLIFLQGLQAPGSAELAAGVRERQTCDPRFPSHSQTTQQNAPKSSKMLHWTTPSCMPHKAPQSPTTDQKFVDHPPVHRGHRRLQGLSWLVVWGRSNFLPHNQTPPTF